MEYFKTKDKQLAPYLLIRSDLQFEGTLIIGPTIYFSFSPYERALAITNKFITHKADLVDPKLLLEAVETYRDIIFEMKEKRKNYDISTP